MAWRQELKEPAALTPISTSPTGNTRNSMPVVTQRDHLCEQLTKYLPVHTAKMHSELWETLWAHPWGSLSGLIYMGFPVPNISSFISPSLALYLEKKSL